MPEFLTTSGTWMRAQELLPRQRMQASTLTSSVVPLVTLKPQPRPAVREALSAKVGRSQLSDWPIVRNWNAKRERHGERGEREVNGRPATSCNRLGKLERAKGIEPSYAAWEAAVLPLNYARSMPAFERVRPNASSSFLHGCVINSCRSLIIRFEGKLRNNSTPTSSW
jgi:hypothetical protein